MKKHFAVILCAILFHWSSVDAGWMGDLKEKAGSAIEKTRDAGHRVKRGVEKTKRKWKEMKHRASRVKKAWDDDSQRRKEINDSVKEKYGATLQKIRDPETRRQAKEMIGAGLEMRRKFLEAKRNGVETGINALSDFPIGDRTLGGLIKEKLGDKFPALDDANLLDRDTAIAAALGDRGFFLREVDFIEKGGRRLSVIDAIGESSPFDAGKTMRYLDVAGALEKLHSTDDVGGAVDGLISAMDAVN